MAPGACGSTRPSRRAWIGAVVGLAVLAAAVAAVARLTVFDLYPEEFGASVTRFAEGPAEIEVDPRQPWAQIPRILPGPADAWAGGTGHALALRLGPRPVRGLVLYLFLGDMHRLTPPAFLVRREAVPLPSQPGGPTRLAVAVNGAAVTTVEIPFATGVRSTDPDDGGLARRRIEIPPAALGGGAPVRLSLVNQSGTAVVLERMRLVEARPTFAWANLGRRGRFPPESAALLAASLALLLLWNVPRPPTGPWTGRALLRGSGPAATLVLLGLAEWLPLDSVLTTEVPRWVWLALPWVLLLVSRPGRPRPSAASPAQAGRPSGEVMRGLARRFAVVVVYLVGLLLFFEGVSRAFLSVDAVTVRLANYEQEVWWRLQWIERRSRDIAIYYAFDEYHPARGWALRPNMRRVPAFAGGVVVSSNSRGVRGLREYAHPKPSGVTRILVLGDSFTFGDEVSDDETYSAYLERMLPDVEVINLGVHGYGHDQMLLYLQEVGAGYQPDLVLLGFVPLDMDRNLLGFRDFAKPRFDLEGDRLVLRNPRVPSPEDVLTHERHRSRFLDLVALFYDEVRSPSRRRAADLKERLTAAILNEFQRTVVQMAATPVFAYLPVEGEISQPAKGLTREEAFFLRYCRDRQVLAIDLRPYFQARRATGVRFKTSGHWGPLEHRTAAEELRAYLTEREIVSRSRLMQARKSG